MARQHATEADFQLVGMSKDPTPGDPELITGVLQRYSGIGDAAEKALNILKKDGAVATGRGSAMDKLREKIGEDLPKKLQKTATSYHDAASAYRDYIPRLEEAQDTFDRAVEQARSAAPAANQPPPVLAPDATDDDKTAAAAAQDTIDAGKTRLSAAKSLAEQALAMRQTAQRTCAEVLDRAAGEAIPERNIFQKINDFFKDFPFVKILLGLLIAVVSVFFPVAGLLLGGALFAITQISAIASGNFKLGDLLVGLIGLVPGASVLKLGGGLVKVGAGAIGRLAPGAARTVKGSIAGIRTSINASRSIGPLVSSSSGRFAGAAVKGFGDKAGDELATEVLNHDQLNAGQIFGAGAAGVVGGAVGHRFRTKPGNAEPAGIPLKTLPGRGSRSPSPSAPPEHPLDPAVVADVNEFPPLGITSRGTGNPLEFTHPKTGADLTLHRTDTTDPVFKIDGTPHSVFVDTDTGKLHKFDGVSTVGEHPESDLTRFTGEIPKDHFLVRGFEGKPFPKVDDIGSLRGLAPDPGRVTLVPTHLLPDPQRALKAGGEDSIKKAFHDGTALPPVKLRGSDLSIDDGNHRIAAAKSLGLPFVPVVISS